MLLVFWISFSFFKFDFIILIIIHPDKMLTIEHLEGSWDSSPGRKHQEEPDYTKSRTQLSQHIQQSFKSSELTLLPFLGILRYWKSGTLYSQLNPLQIHVRMNNIPWHPWDLAPSPHPISRNPKYCMKHKVSCSPTQSEE